MANWAADFILRNNIDPAKIVQKAKHGIHIQKGGEIEATFVGAPCHYQDSKGLWQPIDTALVKNTVSNKWYAPGVPVDISASDGSVSVYGQTWAHKSSRVGIWNPKKGTFAKAWDIPELGAVDGDSFVRSGKGWEYRQRVMESGLRETLTLFIPPKVDLPKDSYLAIESYAPSMPAAKADGETKEWSHSGMWFPSPSAKDSSGSFLPLPCKRWTSGDYLYTGVSAEVLEKAVYPVEVDPDFTGDSGDWWINSESLSYSTARTGTSSGMNLAVNMDTYTVGQQKYSENDWFYLYRVGMKFDTSSIADDTSVADVRLVVTGLEDSSTVDDFLVYVKQAGSGTYWPATTTNMRTIWQAVLSGTSDNSLLDSADGVIDGTQYTSNALSTDYVNKTGATYYGLISENDINNDNSHMLNSGDQELIGFYSAEAATEAYRPKLTVTYHIPHHRTLLGVGK